MKKILEILSVKWPEYILEIIVLILGIYGAFALDRWNDKRLQLKGKQDYIDLLTSNYQANLIQLDEKILLHEALVNSGFSVLETFDKRQQFDTANFFRDLRNMGIDPTFDPTNNDIQRSGDIALIQNPELIRLLTNWNSDIAALRETELMYQSVVYDHYLPTLARMGAFRDVVSFFWDNEKVNNAWLLGQEAVVQKRISRSPAGTDFELLLSNRHLEGLISQSIVMNQAALEQAFALKQKIELTIELLQQEK